MRDEEYLAYRLRLRQILGRMKSLYRESVDGRVNGHLCGAIQDVENALKALRGEPTSAAG